MTAFIIILLYLALLLVLGFLSHRAFRGTSSDYFLASRGIGPFLLVMSLFGTTMTAFALVGCTGEAFKSGIGVYGKLASASSIVHSACFFLIGAKLWALGRKHGYVTQIQFFRDRFESDKIGLVLFPILVGLIVPYLLIGVMSAGTVIETVTEGAFPGVFSATGGGLPPWLGSGLVCGVVLIYVFFGGVRGTVWANAFQTLVFVILGTITFGVIADKLGGPVNATSMVMRSNPTRLKRAMTEEDQAIYLERLAEWEEGQKEQGAATSIRKPEEPHGIPPLVFFSFLLIPLSVGMFPHVFQHWLTAKSSKAFKAAVIAQPLLIIVVWAPCALLGVWATSAVTEAGPVIPDGFSNANAVLALLVHELTGPVLGGLLTAGILAAIMSSLDSQFLCVGSIFANDIVGHYFGGASLSDRARIGLGRGFVLVIVVLTYLLSLANPRDVFSMGVWCFSGYASLCPLVLGALYWKKATRAGAYASILVTGVLWFSLFAASGFGSDRGFLVFGMMPVAVMVGAASVALIVVSWVTRPVAPATLGKFFCEGERAKRI